MSTPPPPNQPYRPQPPQGPFPPAGNPTFRPGEPPARPVFRVPERKPRAKRPWWKSPWFLAPLTFVVGLMLGFSTGAVAMASPEARAPRPTKTITKAAPTVTTTSTMTATQSSSAASVAPAPTVTVTATTTATTTSTATVTAAAPTKEAANSGITDGSYMVGSEIALGTYKSSGGGSLCYADTKDKAGNILEQEIGSSGETVIIRVMSGAYTFTSRGCGTWAKVG